MHHSLNLFHTAGTMAQHAGTQQAFVARNIANADTPGYQAQHVSSFSESYRNLDVGGLRTTRAGHVTADAQHNALAIKTASEAAPNGNTVSLEEELLNSVAISREHSRALAIYRHGLTVLRTTLGKA